MNPKSPIRFVRNAFFAASAALAFVYQCPISRYELTPTSSQKMNIIGKLSAYTIPVIENMNSDNPAKNRAFPASSFMYASEKICTSVPIPVTTIIIPRLNASFFNAMSRLNPPACDQL